MDPNPYAAPTSAIEAAPAVQPVDGPVGLGGWLVLVAIGLFVTPVRLALFLSQTFLPIFRDGMWERLTTPGPAPYHPLWGPLLIGEIAINSVFILLAIYLLFLYFRRSWRFPRLYMTLLISSLVFIVADSFAVGIVAPSQGVMDPATIAEIGKSLIVAAIWVPYMIFSKRVRNTFVRMDV
jgi:hypothetical protein